MQDELARINPLTLGLADAGLEQAFREDEARGAVQIAGKGEMHTFLLGA